MARLHFGSSICQVLHSVTLAFQCTGALFNRFCTCTDLFLLMKISCFRIMDNLCQFGHFSFSFTILHIFILEYGVYYVLYICSYCGQVYFARVTFLPASLLCRFISLRAFFLISRASTKRRENSTPYFTSAEQPPHFQPSS